MIDGRKAIQIARICRHLFCLFCCKLTTSTQSFEADCVYCVKCGQKICKHHLAESFSFNKYKFPDQQSLVCTWTCINCIATKQQAIYNVNTSIKFADNTHYWRELAEQQRKERTKYIYQHNQQYIYNLEENNCRPYLSSSRNNLQSGIRIINLRSESNGILLSISFLLIHLYHYIYIFVFVYVCIHYNEKAIQTVSDQIGQAGIPDELQLPNLNYDRQSSNLNNDQQSPNLDNDRPSLLENWTNTDNKPEHTQSSNQQKKNDDYPYDATSHLDDGLDLSQRNNTTAMDRDDYQYLHDNNYYDPQDNTRNWKKTDYNQHEENNDNRPYDSDYDYSNMFR